MVNYYLQFSYFRVETSKKQPKDQIFKVANKMEKIPTTRNKWVKDQLNWFKENIQNNLSLWHLLNNLKERIFAMGIVIVLALIVPMIQECLQTRFAALSVISSGSNISAYIWKKGYFSLLTIISGKERMITLAKLTHMD